MEIKNPKLRWAQTRNLHAIVKTMPSSPCNIKLVKAKENHKKMEELFEYIESEQAKKRNVG